MIKTIEQTIIDVIAEGYVKKSDIVKLDKITNSLIRYIEAGGRYATRDGNLYPRTADLIDRFENPKQPSSKMILKHELNGVRDAVTQQALMLMTSLPSQLKPNLKDA